MAKKSNKVLEKIKENYEYMEQVICNELELASEHNGLSGHCREERWMDFFRKIIPMKFAMEQGVMIIDSDGGISKEVDIAVFDNQYTPYLFQYGSLKFIPIEAVAVAIECKSEDWDADSLRKWSESIENLNTAPTGISRMVSGYTIGITNNSQKATRPIKILASMKKNAKGETIDQVKGSFDILISESRVKNESDQKISLKVEIPHKEKTLGWWGKCLNMYVKDKVDYEERLKLQYLSNMDKMKNYKYLYFERSENEELYLTNTLKDLEIEGNQLLSLNFQLNQLLMLINNPMLFPHFAYAKAFGAKTKKEGGKSNDCTADND